MRRDVAESLTASAAAFLDVVWPVIAEACGGGELVPVESVTDAGFSKDLDVLAGVDAWQVIRPRGMRGIASRVQPQDRSWDTFTIRWSLRSGAPTEIHKRWLALRDGMLYPELWAHAYVTPERDRLMSVAVIHTKPLIERAVDWTMRYRNEPDLWKARDGLWVKDVTGGNRMLVIPWSIVAEDIIYRWPERPVLWEAA